MIRYGFVFPGQGSQAVGMGSDLYQTEPAVQQLYRQAQEVLGRDIAHVSFSGPAEELLKTSNTQPAIFLVSAAITLLLRQHGIQPTVVAGHSLGEITAYYVSQVLDLQTSLQLISKRAAAMENAYPAADSAMVAVLGMAGELVANAISPWQPQVVVANYNSPEQIVISGNNTAVAQAVLALKTQGAKAIPLKVQGAFHSPFMAKASQELAEFLQPVVFQVPAVPLILNRTAQATTDVLTLKDNLPQQITSSVRWVETIQQMVPQTDVIIECGPGKVLGGLIKKIAPDQPVFSLNDLASLQNFLATHSSP